MTDPSLYWASTQANPDKPRVVVLRLFKPALNHRSMADVMRDEAHCEAMRKARKSKAEMRESRKRAVMRRAQKLRLAASVVWAAVSPDAFTNSARKDDPLARRGSEIVNMKGF